MKDTRSLDIGNVFQEEIDIFSVKYGGDRPYEFKDLVHYTVSYEMNLDLHTIDREVYHALDLVGDTGGVFEGLYVIFAGLLSIFTYKHYDTYMVAQLFQTKDEDFNSKKERRKSTIMEGLQKAFK